MAVAWLIVRVLMLKVYLRGKYLMETLLGGRRRLGGTGLSCGGQGPGVGSGKFDIRFTKDSVITSPQQQQPIVPQ